MRDGADTERPSKEKVVGLLDYDPTTGVFTWRVKRGRNRVNFPAGRVRAKNGYAEIGIGKRTYLTHRLAWLVMTGSWPGAGMEIDHINGHRADNRWCNLRVATKSQNKRNTRPQSNCKSGVRGVSRVDSGKWEANIKAEGRFIKLGRFVDFEDAVRARRAAETKYFGEFSPQLGVGSSS